MEISTDIQNLIDAALKEDLGNKGDITSQATIPDNKTAKMMMNARAQGILAGINIAIQVFKTVDNDLTITEHVQDGHPLKKGQKILTVEGKARQILMAERTALNFLSHLSGIASETHRYVTTIQHTKAKILDTRKTLPGYRPMQKYAVKMGGGNNHRTGLYDMVLIKDNHIAAAGGIKAALDNTAAANPSVKIEIEVDTLAQLQEVLDHGTADIVLLDNMAPEELKKAVALCEGKIITEASGGITMETIVSIAETGVDYISIGALTHSVKAFDIGLDYIS